MAYLLNTGKEVQISIHFHDTALITGWYSHRHNSSPHPIVKIS